MIDLPASLGVGAVCLSCSNAVRRDSAGWIQLPPVAPVEYYGWMTKKGEKRHTWKKR